MFCYRPSVNTGHSLTNDERLLLRNRKNIIIYHWGNIEFSRTVFGRSSKDFRDMGHSIVICDISISICIFLIVLNCCKMTIQRLTQIIKKHTKMIVLTLQVLNNWYLFQFGRTLSHSQLWTDMVTFSTLWFGWTLPHSQLWTDTAMFSTLWFGWTQSRSQI